MRTASSELSSTYPLESTQVDSNDYANRIDFQIRLDRPIPSGALVRAAAICHAIETLASDINADLIGPHRLLVQADHDSQDEPDSPDAAS